MRKGEKRPSVHLPRRRRRLPSRVCLPLLKERLAHAVHSVRGLRLRDDDDLQFEFPGTLEARRRRRKTDAKTSLGCCPGK